MNSISPDQLRDLLESEENIVLLDVRESWEFETCSIGGSINLPISILESKLELDDMDKNMKTVVICHHGMRSFQVAAYMESIGYKEMVNLEGGVDLWARTVDQEMARY